MGKVVRTIAIIAIAVAVAYFAPQLSAFLVSTLGVSAAVGTAIATVGLSMLAAAATSLLAPKPSAQRPAPLNFRQSISNSFIIIGRRRQGGLMVFVHGSTIGSDNFRYFVFASAGHRCHGISNWYLGDEQVTVDGSGMVTSGKYAGAAWLWFARGTEDQAANSTFVSETGGKWTSNHRGRGVALIYAKFKLTKPVIEAGMPTISAEIEGSDEIRDPRDDTLKYTNLAVPAFYWWLQLPREEGGFGATDDEIPDDTLLSAWTNICDEDVELAGGGTEKRYIFDSLIETGAAPSQVRETFVICCAGQHSYIGGKFWMRPGHWVPVTATLSERDLNGPIGLPLLREAEEFATQVSGTFIDPSSQYQPQPVPTRGSAAENVVQLDFDLAHISSHTRGQRILEIMLRRALAEKRVRWPMNIEGLKVQALQTVQLDTGRFGLSNYAWAVDGWSLEQEFGVQLDLREENPDIYAWSVDDELPASGNATVTAPTPIGTIADSAATAGAVGSYDAAAIASLEARIAALEP